MRRFRSQSRSSPRYFRPSMAQIRAWQHASRHTRQTHATKLLRQIETELERLAAGQTPSTNRLGWLLPYRQDIRRVIANDEGASILLYLLDCPREMDPFGVWLLGRCADRFRLYDLQAFCDHPTPAVRKHVAKALRRSETWHRLELMASASPEGDSVRRIAFRAAESAAARPFAERLKRFGRNVDTSHAADAAQASQMPFWASEQTWQPVPPKSATFIRRLLRRIHRWVHGLHQRHPHDRRSGLSHRSA